MSTIDYLPIWKKNATAAERFDELAMIARKHPERFNKIAVVYEEILPNGNTKSRSTSTNCSTTELVGILTIAIKDIIDESQRPQ